MFYSQFFVLFTIFWIPYNFLNGNFSKKISIQSIGSDPAERFGSGSATLQPSIECDDGDINVQEVHPGGGVPGGGGDRPGSHTRVLRPRGRRVSAIRQGPHCIVSLC